VIPVLALFLPPSEYVYLSLTPISTLYILEKTAMSELSIDQPGFFRQSDLPQQVNKAEMIQKVLTGREGMVVWSKIKAGTYTAAHSHPNEQITWMISGRMDFRVADQKRTCVAGDLILIPKDVEHEVLYVEECEIIEFFTPPRLDLYPAAAHSVFGV
jgi:quercetin dioxygenase-like cupin family protein